MEFDTNSPCPGGRNKKIRQCCPHLTKELEQLNSMLHGNQVNAALAYVEGLLKRNADCACLLAAKCELLQMAHRSAEFLETARLFVEQEPDNFRACRYLVIAQILNDDISGAVQTFVDAVELGKQGQLSAELVDPMLSIAFTLIHRQCYPAAIPFMTALEQIDSSMEEVQKLRELCSCASEIPYALREYAFPIVCPEKFSQKDAYDAAVIATIQLRWNSAKRMFESLLPFADDFPEIYKALAILHLWLLDKDRGAELMLKYIQSPTVSDDDRADAHMIYSDLKSPLWGDPMPVWNVECTVLDENSALENLLSSALIRAVNSFDWDESLGPPPRKAFHILDRNPPENEKDIPLEKRPRSLCSFLFFGKQTDRPARIVIRNLFDINREKVITTLKDILGDSYGGDESSQDIPLSTTLVMLTFTCLGLPNDVGGTNLYRKNFLLQEFCPKWINLPLGILDGKTPLEIADHPKEHYKLYAALEMFHGIMNEVPFYQLVTTALRTMLKLPEPTPIFLSKGTDDAFLDEFSSLPFWRWQRVDLSGLGPGALFAIFQLAIFRLQPETIQAAGTLYLDKPEDPGDKSCIRKLYVTDFFTAQAISDGDYDTARAFVKKGRLYSQEGRMSDGNWDVYDAVLAILNMDEAYIGLFNHIFSEHKNEQAVILKLQNYMTQLGLVRPEPTSSVPPAVAESQKLWTPESESEPPAGGSGTSKLWVPGS